MDPYHEHDLTTVQTPVTKLRPHPRNARNGDVDAIMASLMANGQYRPIVVARGGIIIAGNHTYAAALELGWDTLACVHLDLAPDGPEAARIMLADNRTADLGRYDDAMLLDLLQQVNSEIGLDGTGYLTSDLELLEHLTAHPPAWEDDGDAEARRRATIAAARVIHIKGVPDEVWEAWRGLPGESDLDRLTYAVLGGDPA